MSRERKSKYSKILTITESKNEVYGPLLKYPFNFLMFENFHNINSKEKKEIHNLAT